MWKMDGIISEKTISEVADGVLGKSAETTTRNISEKALGLIESRRVCTRII